MSDTDCLTDSAELRELRDSLSGLVMPRRPPVEVIAARGRVHRRHRLTGVMCLAVGGIAAATAAAFGLSGAPRSTGTLGTVRTASYTLVSYTNGTDRLTFGPGELLEPAQLQSDLARSGIAAKVTTGSYCTSNPEPAGFSEVVTGPGQGSWQPADGTAQAPTMTIDPSAMPAGTELSVGYFRLPTGEQQANLSLIDTNSNTCSTTPPPLNSETPGFGLLYGGPGPSGP